MNVVGYLRVSTDHQTNENQRIRIKEFSERRGWNLIKIYEDIESGKKRKRPGLNELLKDARQDKFDKVLSVRVDRISRNMKDLIEIAGRLSDNAVSMTFTEQDLDITSSMGRAMFLIMGVFAELERSVMVERTIAGQNRARRQGKKIGRPKINGMTIDKIKRLSEGGLSIRKISNECKVSIGTVQKVVSEKVGVSLVENDTVHKTEVF